MSKIDIRKGLTEWGQMVKRKIEAKIIATDTIDTGALLRSINFEYPKYSGGEGKWFLSFEMLDYGKYTDLDNPRVKKSPKPPRNFFHKLIDEETEKLEDYIFEDIYKSVEKKLKE
jgi:hypothetical protein